MIIKLSDARLISSESVDLDPKTPMFKCPKCGCIYGSILDVKSNDGVICNECGTELETIPSSDTHI